MASGQQQITDALRELRAGDSGAFDRLLPMVYNDLAGMAHRQLGLERTGHTLSTNALVHEAYLRLVDQSRVDWVDRAHFFRIAASMMRRVLVDYARRHKAARRGSGARLHVPLELLESMSDANLAAGDRADVLLALDEALQRLASLDERQARVVECRFFAGLTESETADALGVTARTVSRDWVKARGWLYQELSLVNR
jgi:RNA polymerase sigma factor (TIGR02999 family)